MHNPDHTPESAGGSAGLTTTSAPGDVFAWLRLMQAPGVGIETSHRLLAAFGLPSQIFEQSAGALARVAGEAVARGLKASPDAALERLAEITLEWLSDPLNHMLTLADSAYPPALLRLPDPPPVLYVKGRLELLARPSLGIVGARNATVQGVRDAQQFARALADGGLTIVSGLALGIDAAAHAGALGTSAGTVAVIGTGADIVYPARNRELAHRIAAEGVIVSELPLGTPALSHNFPRRNRILAGLSLGVLVVEAAARSGSLITARLAAEMGREVFAIPGSIHSPLAKGCHLLIRQGAKLVESSRDILEELRFEPPTPGARQAGSRRAGPRPAANVADASSQAELPGVGAASIPAVSSGVPALPASVAPALSRALSHAPATLDELCASSGLDAATLAAQLLELELCGCIERLPGDRYRLLG